MGGNFTDITTRTPRRTLDATLREWAYEALMPEHLTHLVSISFCKTQAEPHRFNAAVRGQAPQILRDILNVIDRAVYGPRYVRIPKPTRFKFFARGETKSKWGICTPLHFHIGIQLGNMSVLDPQDSRRAKAVASLYRIMRKKYGLALDIHICPVGQCPDEQDIVRSYLTKRLTDDADLVFTRHSY